MRNKPVHIDANTSWIARWLIGFLAIVFGVVWIGMGVTRWSSFWPIGVITLLLAANSALVWGWHVQNTRRLRRIAAGRCPHCGYDRAGIATQAACPECGSAAAR